MKKTIIALTLLTNSLFAQQFIKSMPVTITTNSTTTSYTTGLIINNIGNLTPIAIQIPSVSTGTVQAKITNAHIIINNTNSFAYSGTYELSLFSNSFAITGDNTPYNPSFANLSAYYQGNISFTGGIGTSSNTVLDYNSNAPIHVNINNKYMYAVLYAGGTITKSANMQITIILDLEYISK